MTIMDVVGADQHRFSQDLCGICEDLEEFGFTVFSSEETLA